MTFGEKIQTLRKHVGLSQEALADRLNVSRQAVSKWERDTGYPETEKLVRMSKLFHVSVDDLLNDDAAPSMEGGPKEQETLLDQEWMAGFLSSQKRRLLKISTAVGLFVGSLSLSFWDAEGSMILFLALVILGGILLFSAKLAENPYGKPGALPLDQQARAEWAARYARKGKTDHILTLLGIALMAVGVLLCPMMVPAEMEALDSAVLAVGMLSAGVGAFLCIYHSGMTRTYRRLMGAKTAQETGR